MNVFDRISDSIILKRILKDHGTKEIEELAKKLHSDDAKMEAVRKMIENNEHGCNIARVARELSSDDKKLETMKMIEGNEQYIGFLLIVGETLESDREKINLLYDLLDKTKEEEGKVQEIVLGMPIVGGLGKEGMLEILEKTSIFDVISDSDVKAEVFRHMYEKKRTFEEIEQELKEFEKIKSKSEDEIIKEVDELENEYLRAEILKKLENEESKIEYIRKTSNNKLRYIVMKELSDENKIKYINLLNNKYYLERILSTISDENKIKMIDKFKFNYNIIAAIFDSMSSEFKLKALEQLKSYDLKSYLCTILSNKDVRLDYYLKEGDYGTLRWMAAYKKECKNKEDKEKCEEAERIANAAIKAVKSGDDEKKVKFVRTVENPHIRIEVIETIEDDEKKIECLKMIKEKEYIRLFRLNCEDIDFIKKNIETFMQLEGFEGNADIGILEKLFVENNNIVNTINFDFLNSDNIALLGKEHMNLMGCYPDIQEKFLSLDKKRKLIFVKCIDEYVERAESDEWTVLANELLEHLLFFEYDDLLNDIDNIDELSKEEVFNLVKILQNDNWFKITNMDQVRNWEEIRRKKCEEVMQNDESLCTDVKKAVIQKLFGMSQIKAARILYEYGEDKEALEESDMKYFLRALKEISEITDADILKKIFDSCEYIDTDEIIIKRALKNEFGKLFNEGLYEPKKEDLIEGHENEYEAGVNFKMIITSVGAFSRSKVEDNYRDDWNRPYLASQHFCTSYIRNDMIGTAPIRSVCYGFKEMKEDSLMLSSPKDISSRGGFVSTGREEKYYAPDNQINNTKRYNEMDFRRIQGEKKKQPDYIVVFKKDGEEINKEEALKAQKDWQEAGINLPIVIVDIDKCLEEERKKVNKMMIEYDKNPSIEQAKIILQKVKNNRNTDEKFCEDINKKLEKLNEKVAEESMNNEGTIGVKDLEENHKSVNAAERKEKMGEMEKTYRTIKEIRKEAEKNGR